MADLITKIQKKGLSKELFVGGRTGKFNFDVPPIFSKGVGGGKSPLHRFITPEGEQFNFRLEKDKQGGRWESGKDALAEFNAYKTGKRKIQDDWGDSPTGQAIALAVSRGLSFEELRAMIGNLNTHRQVSGD